MKKKTSILVIMCLLAFGLVGCKNSEDVVNTGESATSSNRFIDTGDKYIIADNSFQVWYDSNTNIVYLIKKPGGYGNSAITVMYDSDGHWKEKNKVVILPYFYVVYQQFSLTEPI